jgi:hypothetical protein
MRYRASARFRSGQELRPLVTAFKAALDLVQKTLDGVTFVGDIVWSLKGM